MKYILLLALSFSSVGFAESGADALLDQLGEKPAATKTKGGAPKKQLAQTFTMKVEGDAFQQQLAIAVMSRKKTSFDVKQWAQAVMDNEYARAAHLWTAIQMQIPADFRHEADATQLYLLWKLGLNQTFFDQWVKALASASYAESNPEQTLETLVTPGLDAWLLHTGVLVTPKSQTILDRMKPTEAFVLTLKAYSDFRREKEAEALLPHMLADNKLTRFVAQTAVYNHVKHNDLKGAARILRDNFEPAIEAQKDAELLAKHDLSIARILYQAGQMKAAGVFYGKIPNQSPSYMPAREELSWVYLRLNDMSNLRGEIKGLSSGVFKDRFQPETYLLRAISNLKMCFYDLLDKDLADFTANNAVWAKRIDAALAAKSVPVPSEPDEYTQMAAHTSKSLEAELAKLSELGDESIGAVLPAVGQQKHWKEYYGFAQASLAEAKKRQNEEYTRQWKNQRSALQEAIRKMRFVKVEYMSQIRQLAGAADVSAPTKMVASNSKSLPASAVVKSEDNEQNFPATSEVWSDELFKLRSAAQAQCLKKAK
jgi:hypothetical protein